jgi:hypothetical protein
MRGAWAFSRKYLSLAQLLLGSGHDLGTRQNWRLRACYNLKSFRVSAFATIEENPLAELWEG